MRAVKDAQAFGFSPAEIEGFLRGARDEDAVRERFAARAREVDEQIASLAATRDELARRALGVEQRLVTGAGPLHVTNGDSAAMSLERCSFGGDTLPWRDAYHDGPVPAGSRDRMLRHRAVFLAAAGFGTDEANLHGLLARDESFVSALREGRPIVLWFEHDLYDQLQLVDVLALAGDVGFEEGALELIEVDAFLGTLDEAALEALWPRRRAVTEDDTVAAQAAWAAVRSSDPRGLLALATSPPASRPFLGAAARRFLQELPWVGDGLSRTERQLLSLLADGPMLSGALFVASQALEEAAFHGDSWIFRTLEQLAPLVEVGEGYAEITDDGHAVLSGSADRVEFGLDRFVGGTHLEAGSEWRWDDVASVLVAPA